MFEFLKIQYQLGRIDAEALKAFVPRWITGAQVQEILLTAE